MPLEKPGWRDVLMLDAGVIAVCVGCAWSLVLISRNSQIEHHIREVDLLRDQINHLNGLHGHPEIHGLAEEDE